MKKIFLTLSMALFFTMSSYAQTDITCCSTADVTAAGGVTYAWDDGTTTALNDDLAAGMHTVTVTDACGQTSVGTFTVINYPTLTVTATGVDNTDCTNPNGSVTATPSGGNGPYSYSWTPTGGTGATTATYSDLSGGTYTVVVTDDCGNTATVDVTIIDDVQPPVVTFNATCN
jgi:hypothetical protein